jgi:maltose O-acetyltransferase
MRRSKVRLVRRLRNFAWERVRGYPTVDTLLERGLTLGENVTLTRGVVLDPTFCYLITVGDDTTFGPEVIVLAHDASTKVQIGYTRIARVRIGARVFVGARSVILPGVTIGDDAVIGAGSIVSRDVAAGVVALGAPAREVMRTEEYVARHRPRLNVAPTYPALGWTHDLSMAPGHATQMSYDLESTDGYVE